MVLGSLVLLFEDPEKWSRFRLFVLRKNMINSIWVRIKLHYANQSTAVCFFAPKRAPFISIPTKFCQGIFRLSQQNILLYHSLIQVLMDCHSWKVFIPFPLEEINHYYSSLVGWKTLVNVSFSLNLFNLFLLPFYFKYFSLYNTTFSLGQN
jgi:hypothetical protein